MAKIGFNEAMAMENSYSGDGVSFFSLKDGEEALVRFVLDSMDELDAYTVHTVKNKEGRWNDVNCIREPNHPTSECPFCAAGVKAKNVVVLKMIQYKDGVPTPVMWTRNFGQWAPDLKGYLDNYGPLSQIMCKIVRHGTQLDTTYQVIPNLNPTVYNLNDYPCDKSAFDDFNPLGRAIRDKSYDDMVYFNQYNEFPAKEKTETPQQNKVSDIPFDVDDTPFAPAPGGQFDVPAPMHNAAPAMEQSAQMHSVHNSQAMNPTVGPFNPQTAMDRPNRGM